MDGPHLPPAELANWVINHELGPDPTPDVLAAAAVRIYRQLRAGLIVYLGPLGFDSLWARAMYVAFGTVPAAGAHDGAAPNGMLPPGVPPVGRERSPLEARAVLSRTFTTVFAVLFLFLGERLGRRLLEVVWPALGRHGSDPQRGDTTV